MSPSYKPFKMHVDLHQRAVALDEEVVERFGPPPNYRRGGPGAAVHAGVALLEAVMNGEQCLVPAPHMQKYEEAYQAQGLNNSRMAMLSTVALCIAMRLAKAEGAEDPDARAAAIVAETIRAFVEVEVLEREAEAEPHHAEVLRLTARAFLDDAEGLAARARAALASEVAQ